jgi:hypothetical protein
MHIRWNSNLKGFLKGFLKCMDERKNKRTLYNSCMIQVYHKYKKLHTWRFNSCTIRVHHKHKKPHTWHFNSRMITVYHKHEKLHTALHAERCKARKMPRQEWSLSYLITALIKTALLSLGDVNWLFYWQNGFLWMQLFSSYAPNLLIVMIKWQHSPVKISTCFIPISI